jgi:hypothetical protein
MDFKPDKPIYRQIIDYAFTAILSEQWREGGRVPSVRELGADLAVNTHTVLKAYEYLQERGIIAVRRGMGYFLEPDAKDKVNADRREHFFETTLDDLFTQMDLLGITLDDLIAHYHSFRDR